MIVLTYKEFARRQATLERDLGYLSNGVSYGLEDLLSLAVSQGATKVLLRQDHQPIFEVKGQTIPLEGCRIGECCIGSLCKEAFSNSELRPLRRRGRQVSTSRSHSYDGKDRIFKILGLRRGAQTDLMISLTPLAPN